MILSFLVYFFSTTGASVSVYLVMCYVLLSLLIIYLIVRVLAEKYIFRKIKLIYKVISDSKDSLKDIKDFNSNSTTLENVNDVAVEWTMKTEKEISSLKTLENYRKQYLGDVSHEMKTPLFAIQGYLLTLLEGGLHDEKVNLKYLKKAAENVDRLQAIVEDLEMINKLESEEEKLEITGFDLKELAESVYADLTFMAEEKNISLVFKQGADQSFLVYADKEKIRQVFVNLITNSIKYGVANGITKLSFYDMDAMVLVEVSDNGIGIAEEDLKRRCRNPVLCMLA